MHEHIIIYTDGGSRGNPGPAASAFILMDTDKTIIEGKALFVGETTNNVAEYTGLIKALSAAKQAGAKTIEVFSDSELMVRQLSGHYRVKSEKLKDLYAKCTQLLAGFASWKVTHVAREKNKQVDAMVNRAMNLKKDITCKQPKPQHKGKPTRLGVLISGGGRTMVNIQKRIEAGELNAKIVLVISSRADVKGVERAKNIGLEPKIIRRKDFDDIDSFSSKIFEELKKARVDLVVQAGWLCLWQIPKEYDNKVMNIHPALLPSFGGQGMWGHHVHEAVLKAGCKVSGCTVHFCTNEYDIGPIIVQRSCEVNDDDDAESLAARVFEQECVAYPEAIELFCENRLVIENGIIKRSEHQLLKR